jgi:hypothetical protein
MGFSQGSAFGINGCKVADGGREDSNGLLTGFSLLGVSGEVSCGYLVVCEASTGDPAQHHFVSGCSTLPSFFYDLSLDLAFGTLEYVLWRSKNLAVGWRWRWVCLETVCDQFWHALPLSGIRCRPGGAHSVNGGRKGELLTLVKRTVMFTSAASLFNLPR